MKSNLASLVFAVLLLAVPLLRAQEDPAFRAWQQAEQKKFQEFRGANDRAFYEFL